jgi:hypothetical protein
MIYLILACTMLPLVAASQSQGSLGLMGGSGVTLSPTTDICPESQFRLDVVQLDFLRKGSMNLTGTDITAGLSTNFELFAKFHSGETKTDLSQPLLGLGGKYLLPVSLHPFDRIALWSEIMSTENTDRDVFYPSQVMRSAMLLQPSFTRSIPVTILMGMTSVEAQTGFLGGVSSSWAASPSVKVGAEFVYGYYAKRDAQELATLGVRLFSHLSVQVSPGYFHSPERSSWLLLMGISITSAEIAFIPKPREKEVFVVPPIEDMEKKSQEEPKKE